MSRAGPGRFPVIDRISYGLCGRKSPAERCDTQPPIRSVPWSLVEPLRERCRKIHDQTLERLAARGGLGPEELWAHLHWSGDRNKDFWSALEHDKTPDELRTWLRTLGGEP